MFDYLVIGHITHDVTPAGFTLGGTVAYSGRVAQALGCRTAVLTSAGPDCDLDDALPDITAHSLPAGHTSTFENIYTPAGRRQVLHGVAGPISAADIPDGWDRATIVHLGPLTNEVEPEMIHRFSNSLIGLTPQGWLRRWDDAGHVYAREWEKAKQILPLAAAVILSEEDLLHADTLEQYRAWSRLLVLTAGARGCAVFLGDEVRQLPAPTVDEVDLTGAGDIFAAAFLVRLHQTRGNPWEAARFANHIASQSVTQTTLEDKVEYIKHLVNVAA